MNSLDARMILLDARMISLDARINSLDARTMSLDERANLLDSKANLECDETRDARKRNFDAIHRRLDWNERHFGFEMEARGKKGTDAEATADSDANVDQSADADILAEKRKLMGSWAESPLKTRIQ